MGAGREAGGHRSQVDQGPFEAAGEQGALALVPNAMEPSLLRAQVVVVVLDGLTAQTYADFPTRLACTRRVFVDEPQQVRLLCG